MTETLIAHGRIKAVAKNRILFALQQPKPCPGCNGRCGLLTWKHEGLKHPIWIKTDETFLEGETVEIHYPAVLFAKNSIKIYLGPLIALVLGILLAEQWFDNELVSFLFGMAGLTAGILYFKRSNRSNIDNKNIRILHHH